uniref:JAB_MPN domain-containing protein n=1 Tax=Parastrongyloides trichosuri TaxID=131310 RepID=A0A0N4ZL81_PARTI
MMNANIKYNIYPLSVLSITDHYTRILRTEENRGNEKVLQDKNIKVFGCIFGTRDEKAVNVYMSLEGSSIRAEYLNDFITKRVEDYGKIFNEYKCLGLYFTGIDSEVDSFEKNLFVRLNNEVFYGSMEYILKYNPIDNDVYVDNIRKLPMTLYERKLNSESEFNECSINVVFSETERIVIGEVIKTESNGGSSWKKDRVRNLIAYKNSLLKQGCKSKVSNENNKDEDALINEILQLSESLDAEMSKEDFQNSVDAINDAEIALLYTKIVEGANVLHDFNSTMKQVYNATSTKGLDCVGSRNI